MTRRYTTAKALRDQKVALFSSIRTIPPEDMVRGQYDGYRQIDGVRKPGSIVSSNTSTIPIALLVEDMPAAFRSEFAITHFFNPVRYMRLLELVRGEDTRGEVIDSLASFNESRMGKGIVHCNDTPGFLANRVGVFAIQTALHLAFRLGLTPEQADAVFGRPLGIPKTGVFGLYDLIGIDLMRDVVRSLVDILPEQDRFHEVATELPLMQRMIDEGRTGNKSRLGGFYRRVRADDGLGRETLDFESFDYRPFDAARPGVATAAEPSGDFTRLLASDDPGGRFAWEILASTFCYAAELIPDVNASLVAVDDAMKLGYNWIRGPFEMMDVVGGDALIARLESERRDVPEFLRTAAGRSFYRAGHGQLEYLAADGDYRPLARAPGVMRFSERRRTLEPLIETAVASYFGLPDGIGLVEFHSKANTLDGTSMQLLADALAHATREFRGLIIHNDAQHFSCGVNLEHVLQFVRDANWGGLDGFLHHFQQTVASLKRAPIPVVAAPSGLSLGGGFEVVLHADRVICHANSVMGLVEPLVGLVPGGGGVKEMLHRWTVRQGNTTDGAWKTFMNTGYGVTARSPLEAAPLCFWRDGIDQFVMNRDRLLACALEAVDEMSRGYSPAEREPLPMPGRDVRREMTAWLDDAHGAGKLTRHDVTTGAQIAMIVTGGDVDPGTAMSEDDLFDLERQAFVTLARTPETRARIEFMLEHGRPLRN